MWVRAVFKRMISSSNFVAIARLVVLARKDPGTTSPFLRKVNIRKERSISKCPTSFKLTPSLTRPQSSSRNARCRSRGWWEGIRVSLPLFPPSHHTPRATKERQREREREKTGDESESPTLTEHSPLVFVTVTVSTVAHFKINIKRVFF